MSTILNKDAIFAASDLPRERVEVPEWGGAVVVRTPTAAERDAFEIATSRKGEAATDLQNLRARFAVLVCCDEAGRPLFGEGDAIALGSKSCAALDRIFDAGRKLNRMGADATKEAGKN